MNENTQDNNEHDNSSSADMRTIFFVSKADLSSAAHVYMQAKIAAYNLMHIIQYEPKQTYYGKPFRALL